MIIIMTEAIMTTKTTKVTTATMVIGTAGIDIVSTRGLASDGCKIS